LSAAFKHVFRPCAGAGGGAVVLAGREDYCADDGARVCGGGGVL